jgi:hypothetical protein
MDDATPTLSSRVKRSSRIESVVSMVLAEHRLTLAKLHPIVKNLSRKAEPFVRELAACYTGLFLWRRNSQLQDRSTE